ncbi:extensin family protein [Rhizobium mesoamericanum]|uniref:Extensin family protein n=1 Tax=Rhizobium mesoamericanum STM3625 TaxID=1211777 RepID=K0PPX6_9HYPH|nr:extensin family protein [Rhizobium mesoamericanum]CCM75923.1 Extensin family protein [Rhizobium mesoamericanum STM3625]
MALVPILRQYVLPVLLSTALVTCSTDGLIPPGEVDNGTRVGSISAPERRVAAARMQTASTEQAYPVANAPVGDAAGSVDYLNTPNLAGTGRSRAGGQPQTLRPTGRLPMIDSDEAMAGAQGAAGSLRNQPSSWGGTQQLAVPEGGVNMDAELGAEPVVGLAEEQQQQIAEGQSDQPVVDGIGTENPVQLNRARIPAPAGKAQIGSAPAWPDGRPVVAPARVPAENEAQEVAMLRPNNPNAPMVSEPAAPVAPSMMPASELACRRELKRMGVVYTEKPPISQGPACQVPYPISLQGLSGNIGVQPEVTLNCQVTLAFAKWVKNELAPSARFRYWSGIKTIQPLGGYSCRRMNNSRQRYNPMSEHARGNAIDVGKFVLKSGHEIDVRKKGLFSFREGRLLQAVRSDSCKYFNTVLGPGSNPEHWNHFHFDLRARQGGRVYCD